MTRIKKAKCPECGENFDLEEYLGEGETTVCPGCDAELKIVKLEPPVLETAGLYSEEDDLEFEEELDEGEDGDAKF